MDYLEVLLEIVPPPPNAVGTGIDWQGVATNLGCGVPDDYREIVSVYGQGSFGDFYHLLHPLPSSGLLSIAGHLEARSMAERGYTFFADAGYCFFPEDNGLLPYLIDDNGNDYFWLTSPREPSEEWQLVQCEHRGEGFRHHRFGLAEFLVRVFQGELPALASDFPTREDRKFALARSTADRQSCIAAKLRLASQAV